MDVNDAFDEMALKWLEIMDKMTRLSITRAQRTDINIEMNALLRQMTTLRIRLRQQHQQQQQPQQLLPPQQQQQQVSKVVRPRPFHLSRRAAYFRRRAVPRCQLHASEISI